MRCLSPFGYRALAVLAFSLSNIVGLSVAEAGGNSATDEFLIEATVKGQNGWLIYSGRFQSSGAIKDGGTAVTSIHTELYLSGRHGDLEFDFWLDEDGTRVFTIIHGTGDYTDLVGVSGVYAAESQVKRNGDIITDFTLMGSIAP